MPPGNGEATKRRGRSMQKFTGERTGVRSLHAIRERRRATRVTARTIKSSVPLFRHASGVHSISQRCAAGR